MENAALIQGRVPREIPTSFNHAPTRQKRIAPGPTPPIRNRFRAIVPIVLVNGLIAAAPPAHADRYEFDPRRTEVRFSYVMAFATQRGRFTKVKGTLDYDENAPEKSKVRASIAAASLSTGEAIVDSKLKGADFFNVEAAPVISFKSLDVKAHSATKADVAGEITVNGITRPVVLKVTLEPHDDPALKFDVGARKFSATTRIQRSAFNMTSYQALVEDEVNLEIEAIVRPRKRRQKQAGR